MKFKVRKFVYLGVGPVVQAVGCAAVTAAPGTQLVHLTGGQSDKRGSEEMYFEYYG